MDRDALYHIIDYILNNASDDELDAIAEAVRRRQKSSPLDRLNFKRMAEQTTERLESMMPDIRGMARNMIASIVRTNQPGLSQAQVEEAVNSFFPSEGQRAEIKESQLPPDLLQSMLRQFIEYSLGRMPAEEEARLRNEMPDWPQHYWEFFSEDTRRFVRDAIESTGR